MTAAEQARQDAATHTARRQSELDRIAAMTPEQRMAEQGAFNARIASLVAGVNLIGTPHQGKSAAQLRVDDPMLADKWARFITDNKAALVADIAGCVR